LEIQSGECAVDTICTVKLKLRKRLFTRLIFYGGNGSGEIVKSWGYNKTSARCVTLHGGCINFKYQRPNSSTLKDKDGGFQLRLCNGLKKGQKLTAILQYFIKQSTNTNNNGRHSLVRVYGVSLD
jgi:hypothetical protein